MINGKPLEEVQYSDRLLEFLLKANNPTKFNPPKETINLLDLEPELLTSAQLDKLLEHLIVKMVGPDPEAQEAARRELAAPPVPMGTPSSRLREAAEALQGLFDEVEQLVKAGAGQEMLSVLDKIRVIKASLAPATAVAIRGEG
jgi:hypothetical protein